MSREKCVPSTPKVLDRGSQKQWRDAADVYSSVLKMLDTGVFCF
jgi:hypothetical protein